MNELERDFRSKAQLIDLVHKIAISEGSEVQVEAWLVLVEKNVPHPAVLDLIFYSEEEMTAEQIVETALAYQPVVL